MSMKSTYEELEQRIKKLENAVSERKQAEEALRESEERFQRFAQNASEGIGIAADGIVQDVSDRFAELTGYSREELIGNSLFKVFYPDDHRLIGTNIKRNYEDPYECRILRKDGSVLYVEIRGTVITHKGKKARMAGVYDITERKRAEEALRESEALLKKSQEIAHTGSWKLDLVTNRLAWSDEVYRMVGLRPQEFDVNYEAFLDTVHPDDRAAVDEAYSGSLREGRDSYEIEHRIVRRDSGEIRVVHEKCEHIRDVSERIVRSVGMVQDITERKQAEEEREKLIKNLQKALKEIKTLRGILPLCSFCKKIRDDKGYWEQVDVYIHKHSQADISHGICPECAKEHYPYFDIHDD